MILIYRVRPEEKHFHSCYKTSSKEETQMLMREKLQFVIHLTISNVIMCNVYIAPFHTM